MHALGKGGEGTRLECDTLRPLQVRCNAGDCRTSVISSAVSATLRVVRAPGTERSSRGFCEGCKRACASLQAKGVQRWIE